MCSKSCWKRFASFIFTFTLSICIVNFAQTLDFGDKKQEEMNVLPRKESGSGFSACSSNVSNYLVCFACKDGKYTPPEKFQSKRKLNSEKRELNILSKPRANYTSEAEENFVEGKVLLRVVFLANGKVGNITPIKELSLGLTEQAIAAAKKIKFEPAKRSGAPYTVVKQVEYNFTIY